MNHQVFVSYSSHDREIAFRVCRALESAGVRCWIAPRDIAAGADWGGSIARAIDATEVVVLVFSSNADNSDQIKKELVLAGNASKVVIPARVENLVPANPSFRYELASRQWIDLFDNWEAGIARIIGTIGGETGRSDGTQAAFPSGGESSDRQPVAPKAPATDPVQRKSRLAIVGVVAIALLAVGAVVVMRDRSGDRPTVAERQRQDATATKEKGEVESKQQKADAGQTAAAKEAELLQEAARAFKPEISSFKVTYKGTLAARGVTAISGFETTIDLDDDILDGAVNYPPCRKLGFSGEIKKSGDIEDFPHIPSLIDRDEACPYAAQIVAGKKVPGGLEITLSIVRYGVQQTELRGMLKRKLSLGKPRSANSK
jgi:hypothetical protein